MLYTARQLEDLWKATGGGAQVVLPYRARLSPLAADWVRHRKIQVGYSDIAPSSPLPNASPIGATTPAAVPLGAFEWWCDGPCGTAKAALMSVAKEAALGELGVPADARQIALAIKRLAQDVKSGKASGGVIVVSTAATALVLANRCPSLRAIVGTCMESVEQGISQMAANVLVLEHPHKTLQQMRNMLLRFAKAKRELSDDTKRVLAEMASCG